MPILEYNFRRDGDNRTEYIQYRLDPTSTRTGVNLVSSTGPGQRQAHAHLQENYTADLQRITEPRRTETESRSSSQVINKYLFVGLKVVEIKVNNKFNT